MSISFFIKNLNNKESITPKKVLEIGEAISQYNLDESDENIEEFLNEKLENFECILLGEEGRSARGFELSYSDENRYYGIRVFTPCSIGDWEVVFEFIEKLGKFLENNNLVNEHGEEYTLATIRNYPYIEDIEYGIKSIEENLKEKGSEISKLYGIYRPISFNNELLESIKNSENPVETFSNFITKTQYIDAYSARQRFYKNNNDEIFGMYTLTETVRTILPFKPSVEYENFGIVKNEDVKFWRLVFVIIDGNPDDENSYKMLGDIDYFKFIKNLPKDKYSFIDGEYMVVESLEKEEIERLYNLLVE